MDVCDIVWLLWIHGPNRSVQKTKHGERFNLESFPLISSNVSVAGFWCLKTSFILDGWMFNVIEIGKVLDSYMLNHLKRNHLRGYLEHSEPDQLYSALLQWLYDLNFEILLTNFLIRPFDIFLRNHMIMMIFTFLAIAFAFSFSSCMLARFLFILLSLEFIAWVCFWAFVNSISSDVI